MKLISNSPYISNKMGLVERLQGMIKFGRSWYPELVAQEKAIESLRKQLDNRFTLIHYFTLPQVEIPIPLILIGPSGVHVIYVTPLKGVYRSKADGWAVLDASRHFKQTRPNLVQRTALMSNALEIFFQQKGFPITPESILFCSDPGIHVDSIRSVVRIVLSDALSHFAAGLVQGRVALPPDKVAQLLEIIQAPEPAPEEILSSEQKLTPAKKSIVDQLHLSRRQMTVLGVFAFLEVCILIAFIFFVVFSLGA